ncbi:MAG: choice-of-anchor D domain-containing protein [Candidatus Thermoplasmatota archaeon]|nr:choice-of-anchor D domain-containing protein [Candidatus Thermoplasmatota archaeon]
MKKIIVYGIVFLTVVSVLGAGGIASMHLNTRFLNTSTASVLVDDISAQHHYEQTEQASGGFRDWTIIASYDIPEGASGLAYDGTYLYCGIYGANGDEIYRISPVNGSYTLAFTGTQADAYGLTYDGQYLWTTDHPGGSSTPAVALQYDWSGNLLSQFNLPTHYISGIAYDNGDFWVSQYYPDPSIIYKVTTTGTVLQQFTAPDNQPWDLCVDNNYLWMADYWGDTLYKINTTTGALVDSHASEGVDPAGIVYDGQYLWYCDNGINYNVDTLYKVDLLGSGTPEIYVPVTTHDYGTVTVGQSVTWNATVQNVGTATLSITGVVIPGSVDVSCPATFPITVPEAGQTTLPFVYAPQTAVPLNAIVTIQSNDPLHPEVQVTLLGNGVSSGPDINLPEPSHNYGPIRMHATKRWFMEIQNLGDATLTVSSITSNNTQFFIDAGVSFPINIGVIDSFDVPVWYQPATVGLTHGTLTITSNDPDENPFLVSVQGSGLDAQYPIGDQLWQYYITTSYDNSPKAMAPIDDISGDGISDVIVCSEDDYVRCFNGNAHGTAEVLWEHEIYAGSVYSQKALAITQDIDNDGYKDVVVGAAWGGRLIRMISGKTGATIWTHDTHEYGGGGWVYQVDCRFDYNNDGVLDVLANTGDDSTDTGPKRVYCLDGLTGVSIWECPMGGPGYSVIGVEDFTGDTIPDVLAGASNEAETIGYAFGINGATGSILWTFTAAGTSVWALAQLDDISGDGIADVAIGDFTGHMYGLNVTNGAEVWNHFLGSYIITQFELLDDVNNNGHQEIVPRYYGSSVRVIDSLDAEVIWVYGVADKPACIARCDDISGDQINDLFVGTLFSNNYCYFLNGVNGTELESFSISTPVDAIAAIPDIVGDLSMEMVVGGRDGRVICYSGGLGAIPIQADFSVDVTQGTVPLTVQFTDLSTAFGTVITSWEWDFESDGTVDSFEQNPQWTYAEEGVYTVTLTVSDGEFTDAEVKEDYITVNPGQAQLAIGEITGGLFKVSAELLNNGTGDVTDVNWSIQLSGGLVLLGKTAQDILPSLPQGSVEVVTDRPVFGLGRVQITVSADAEGVAAATKTVDAVVFLFVVIIR